jgi:hypothetical protein
MYGLRPTGAGSAISTIQNNTIGFSAAPITCSSTMNTSRMVGIYTITGGVNMTGNTVAYLSNNSTYNGPTVNASLVGIQYEAATSVVASTISQNHVHSLTNTNSSIGITVTGIAYSGPSGFLSTISKNLVHSLSAANNSSNLNGIYIFDGQSTVSNNMISLGLDASGASITNGTQLTGLLETQGVNKFYFNSVYIGGSGVTGTTNSYAFLNSSTSGSRDCSNNIFYNARSNGSGTGKHYAMSVAGTAVNPPGLTSNYNDLFASGTGGVLGLFNSVDQPTLAAWQTATGQDLNSITGNPQFINPAGTSTTVDLHITPGNPIVESAGTLIASITDDYDGQARTSFSPTDIGADAGNFSLLPVLGTYPNASVMAGRNTIVTPSTAPTNTTSAVAY